MFSVSFDAAGMPNERDVFTVAGVISSTEQWGRLEKDWERALIDAGVPAGDDGTPLPFHMTDFENRKEPFDDEQHWTNKRRIDLIGRLTRTMARRVSARFSCSILMKDWYALEPVAKQMTHWPYAIGALTCAASVAEWNYRCGNREPVAYLFEAGTFGEGALFDAFDQVVKEGLGDKYYIGPRTKEDKKRPQLQAADIHAYEIRKHFLNEIRQGGRRERKSFSQILEIPDGGDSVITGKHLIEWNHEFLNGSSDRPAGVRGERVVLNKRQTTRIKYV